MFNTANEKLQDKVVAIELAGNNIFIANDNDNFRNELISTGPEKVEPYYSASMPIGDVEKRVVLFQKLIEIGALFFDARDWSPSEIVRRYHDKGLIGGNYLRIAWRNKQDLNITTEQVLKITRDKQYEVMITDNKEIKKRTIEFQAKFNIIFSQLYIDFLAKINDGDVYEVDDPGICLYSYSDLEERNQVHQIKDFELNYSMIGQDGDLRYFINIGNPTDNSIYSNNLGALGFLGMEKEPSNIFDLIGQNEK